MAVLWKTPSHTWRSITLVTHTGKAHPSWSGWQHVSEEAGGRLSSCDLTAPLQRERRVSGCSYLSCFSGPTALRLLHGHKYFCQRLFFFQFFTPYLVPILFLRIQAILDTSQKNKYCRFGLDLLIIAAATSCVCCTICWPQPPPCWAISAQQLPHRASVLLKWDH